MSNEELTVLMDETIKKSIEDLSDFEPGTPEHSNAVSNLATLYKARIDEDKVDYGYSEEYSKHELEEKKFNEELEMKQEQFNAEMELKEQQHADEMALKEKQIATDRFSGILNLALGAGGLALYAVCFFKGLKFEETGSITSSFMRNLINTISPKKR